MLQSDNSRTAEEEEFQGFHLLTGAMGQLIVIYPVHVTLENIMNKETDVQRRPSENDPERHKTKSFAFKMVSEFCHTNHVAENSFVGGIRSIDILRQSNRRSLRTRSHWSENLATGHVNTHHKCLKSLIAITTKPHLLLIMHIGSCVEVWLMKRSRDVVAGLLVARLIPFRVSWSSSSPLHTDLNPSV